MAAKGSVSKEQITAQILAAFQGSFTYDKEIRIPIMENGELLQIKCVLTCAKVNVENGGDTAVPGTTATVSTNQTAPSTVSTGFMNPPVAPSAEEKQAVADLVSKLGLA